MQSHGRPVEIDWTERVLNEVLRHAKADRLPGGGPHPGGSDAARIGWVLEKMGNRPLKRHLGTRPKTSRGAQSVRRVRNGRVVKVGSCGLCSLDAPRARLMSGS